MPLRSPGAFYDFYRPVRRTGLSRKFRGVLALQRAFRPGKAPQPLATGGFLWGRRWGGSFRLGGTPIHIRRGGGRSIRRSGCHIVRALATNSVAAAARGRAARSNVAARRAAAPNFPAEVPAMGPFQHAAMAATAAAGRRRAAGVAYAAVAATAAAILTPAAAVHVGRVAAVRPLLIAVPEMIDAGGRVIAGPWRINIAGCRAAPDVPRRLPEVDRSVRSDACRPGGSGGRGSFIGLFREPCGIHRDFCQPRRNQPGLRGIHGHRKCGGE